MLFVYLILDPRHIKVLETSLNPIWIVEISYPPKTFNISQIWLKLGVHVDTFKRRNFRR